MRKKKLKKAAAPAAQRRRLAQAEPRTRRSPEDILNRIVQAATGEFKRHGFSGTTTASIAHKAEVTEAQLFRYFGSKSNLFRETIFKPLDQHLSKFIDEHLRDDADAHLPENANRYMAEFQRFITEHAGMLTSLVVAQTYDNGDAQGVGDINSLRTYFERGAARHTRTVGGNMKADPRLLVRVSFVTVLAAVLFRDWIFPPGLASKREIQNAINCFVMDGLGVKFKEKSP